MGLSHNEVGWRTNLQATIGIPARGGKRIRPTVADKKKAPVGPSGGSILQTTELKSVGSSGLTSAWCQLGHPADHGGTRWKCETNWNTLFQFGCMDNRTTSKAGGPERMSRAIGYMDMTTENHTSKMPGAVALCQNSMSPAGTFMGLFLVKPSPLARREHQI